MKKDEDLVPTNTLATSEVEEVSFISIPSLIVPSDEWPYHFRSFASGATALPGRLPSSMPGVTPNDFLDFGAGERTMHHPDLVMRNPADELPSEAGDEPWTLPGQEGP